MSNSDHHNPHTPPSRAEEWLRTPDRHDLCASPQWGRRDFVTATGAAVVSTSGLGMSACSLDAWRGFQISDVFDWNPRQLMRDLAFRVTSGVTLDYIDVRCRACGHAFRAFLVGLAVVDIATMVTCPYCSIPVKATVRISRYLFRQLAAYGVARALALPSSDGYFLHMIGATANLSVARSSVAYDVVNREPRAEFPRDIRAVPTKINYFTDVRTDRRSRVYHVWRRNGLVTDKIRLQIGGARWRTWSRKHNLGDGNWIVTTESARGEIIDCREFFILR